MFTRQNILSLAALVALLCAPAVAAATDPAHGDGHEQAAAAHGDGHAAGAHQPNHLDNWWSLSFGADKAHKNPPIGWAWINFGIIVVILIWVGRKPFAAYLRQRSDAVKKELDAATELREQAQRQLEQIERKIAGLDAEIAGIKQAVADDAELEKKQIIAAAEAEATRIIENADRAMAEELKRAKHQLELEAIDAAMTAAEKLLKRRINEGDHKRLDEEYMVQLASSGGVQ